MNLSTPEAMHKLPNEIVHAVFIWAHRDTTDDDGSSTRPPVEATISAVCTRWRQISLSSPSLWSVFRCVTPSEKMVSLQKDRLETYLSRSRAVELDLFFRFANLHSCTALLLEMLNLSVEHVERWRCFTLLSDGQDNTVVPFQQSLATPLSAAKLQYLDIRTSYTRPPARRMTWTPNILLLGAPPPLQFLRLTVSAVLINFRPRLDNLVHFMLESSPGASVDRHEAFFFALLIDILKLPSLETMSLSGGIWGSYYPEQHSTPVEANRLKHLRVRYLPCNGFLPFFIDNVSAPCLESLTFHRFMLWYPPSPNTPTASSTLAPFPSLRSLHLIGNVIPDYPGNNDVLRQLEHRTRHAKKLTILPHSISIRGPFPSFIGNDMLLLHPFPEVEELVLITAPEHPPPDDLCTRWPKLKRLIAPPHHIRQLEGVVVEELKQDEGIYWPPSCRWESCGADDPFFRDYRDYSSQNA